MDRSVTSSPEVLLWRSLEFSRFLLYLVHKRQIKQFHVQLTAGSTMRVSYRHQLSCHAERRCHVALKEQPQADLMTTIWHRALQQCNRAHKRHRGSSCLARSQQCSPGTSVLAAGDTWQWNSSSATFCGYRPSLRVYAYLAMLIKRTDECQWLDGFRLTQPYGKQKTTKLCFAGKQWRSSSSSFFSSVISILLVLGAGLFQHLGRNGCVHGLVPRWLPRGCES